MVKNNRHKSAAEEFAAIDKFAKGRIIAIIIGIILFLILKYS